MIYIYLLSIILSGAGLAWYGPKKYGLSFAISYLFSTMIAYCIIFYYSDSIPYFSYVVIFNLSIALCIFLFTKFFTYLIAWEIITIPLLIIAIKISAGEPNPILGLVILILPILIVYKLRKYIKKIALGIFSGLSIGIGLSLIFALKSLEELTILNDTPIIVLMIMLISIVGGLYFQFSKFNSGRLDEDVAEN